jgi:hypothetical protein
LVETEAGHEFLDAAIAPEPRNKGLVSLESAHVRRFVRKTRQIFVVWPSCQKGHRSSSNLMAPSLFLGFDIETFIKALISTSADRVQLRRGMCPASALPHDAALQVQQVLQAQHAASALWVNVVTVQAGFI